MALPLQKFREIVFQLLYSYDTATPDEEAIVELMMNELAVSKKNVKLAQERVQQVLSHLPEIDAHIASVSLSYDFDRIQKVTKNILRLAIFELLFDHTIPPKVAIAEAIRLSRKFSTRESASFVNAILDHVYQSILGNQTTDLKEIEAHAQRLKESEEQAQQASLEQQQLIEDQEGIEKGPI
jgi:N utilization substance protein B